jgi:helicase
MVARAWTRAGDAALVAEAQGCYPFEVERLRESLGRLAQAMEAVLERPSAHQALVERLDEETVPLRERVRALGRMLESGLDEEAATLTLAPGVGPTLARRLRDAGCAHLEDLALADPAALVELPGIGKARAARLVEATTELVRSRSALRYIERGDGASLAPAGWPTEVDPYRLRRALDLTVRGGDGGCYEVRGGMEPHQVRFIDSALQCDCADAASGRRCKHALAVLLARGDQEAQALARRLSELADDTRLSLFDLWFDGRGKPAGRSPR